MMNDTMQIPAQENLPHWVIVVGALMGPAGAAIGAFVAKVHTAKGDRKTDARFRKIEQVQGEQTKLLAMLDTQMEGVLDGAKEAREIAKSTRDTVNRIAGKLGVEGTR